MLNRLIYFNSQANISSATAAMADFATTTTETPTYPFKIIAGADAYGAALKDAMVSHLRSLNIEVEDLGTTSYYCAGAEVGRRVSSGISSDHETRGLVACGTGVGVAITANKFPGVYAATCLSTSDALNARSISNSNVLALSGMSTPPETAVEILTTWLNTPSKSPCPASGSKPWNPEISSFLDESLAEIAKIGEKSEKSTATKDGVEHCSMSCPIHFLAKNRQFDPVETIPGGSMKIVRQTPTSAIVRFSAGSMEPAHHHTFGHDVVVLKGKKSVWNLTKKERYDLVSGDYLYTPAGDVHRVKYYEDTEFFITWDGNWDLLLDEDLEAAKNAIEKESTDDSPEN